MAKAKDRTELNYETHAPGSGLKGGGFRGGPKRWTGKGPRPARHIPWPEIFRHHLSVVEGHEKMIDMIRKHTVEGSENWRTITAMQERCREMLVMTKKATREFVPPTDLLEQVPIGSSSASMYPGYSPADHIYGEAASEYGRQASEARKSGQDAASKTNGLDHRNGAAKAPKVAAWDGSSAGLGANSIPLGLRKAVKDGNKDDTSATSPVNDATDSNPFFVIDTNPTPVVHQLPQKPVDHQLPQKPAGHQLPPKPAPETKEGHKRKRESAASSTVHEMQEDQPAKNKFQSKKNKKAKRAKESVTNEAGNETGARAESVADDGRAAESTSKEGLDKQVEEESRAKEPKKPKKAKKATKGQGQGDKEREDEKKSTDETGSAVGKATNEGQANETNEGHPKEGKESRKKRKRSKSRKG